MPFVPSLYTVGRIARHLQEPIHRIEYVLTTRRGIEPAARAGRLRLFNSAQVEQIRRAIAEIDVRTSKEVGR